MALLGRGGMGEVYLADDFELDQPIALKFLSDAAAVDAARLAQLRGEVRTARLVSHPNVCRVHDVGEADGHYFLTMEYIAGEDLAAGLKRIGRLSEERGLDLARQICAGLSAAHARGVLHRDLKPANVLLDADGRAHITDFGLAVVGGSLDDGLAGTPGYMAPEQLAGRPASEQSDIFALGLLLYELFTGRRAFEAKSVAELVREHEFRSFALPTEIVPGLPMAIERVILSCLETDPANRPRSALAVAAALPGTDPLAAALQAGETPSPEMVAAAGGDSATLQPGAGLLLLLALVVVLVGVLRLADRSTVLGALPAGLRVDVLADRAAAVERALAAGAVAASVHRASGFGVEPSGAAFFWKRGAPSPIVPADPATRSPGPDDPPLRLPGETIVRLDLEGRLLEAISVPSRVPQRASSAAAIDWTPLFAAAGLRTESFSPAAAGELPAFFAGDQRAWTGTAGAPQAGRRVEAASLGGRIVSFRVAGPLASNARSPEAGAGRAETLVSFVATVIVLPLTLAGCIVLARRNLSRGRGDRRAAWRLGLVVFGLSLAAWALLADHVPLPQVELSRLSAVAAQSLLLASVLALLYLALEPHARRVWPQVLVSWSRLMDGRFRDPVVGRDLLVGVLAGAAMTLVTLAHYELPRLLAWPAFKPAASNLAALLGTRAIVGSLADHLVSALLNALLGAAGLALARLLTRRRWSAYALATAFFSFLASRDQFQTGVLALDLVLGAILVLIVLGAIFRFGLLAGLAAFFAHFASLRTPATLDPSRPYFETGLAVAALLVIAGAAGFVMSRAKEPLLGRWLGEP